MRREPFAEMKKTKSSECAFADSRLLDYLDGTLNAAEHGRLQGHLAQCASCREEFAHQQLAEAALAGSRAAIPTPGDLRAGFYTRLAAENAARRGSNPLRWWLFAAPTAIAAALVVTLWPAAQDNQNGQTNEARSPQVALLTPLPKSNASLPSALPQRENEKDRTGTASFDKPALRSSGRAMPRVHSAEKSSAEKSSAEKSSAEKTLPLAMNAKPALFNLHTSAAQNRQKNTFFGAEAHSRKPLRDQAAAAPPAMFEDADAASNKLGRLRFHTGVESSAILKRAFDYKDDAPSKNSAPSAKPSAAKQAWGENKASLGIAGKVETNAGHGAAFKADVTAEAEDASNAPNDSLYYLRDDARRKKSAIAESLVLSKVNVSLLAEQIDNEPDEVDLQVTDDERGFECSTRIAGTIEQKPEGEVLTLEAESNDGT